MVEFFHQYDAQATKAQADAYAQYRSSQYYYVHYGRDCSPIFSGVTILFSNLRAWGFAGASTVLELKNDPAIINGPIPTLFGIAILGHEISHWKQGIHRFSFQGEVLARHVERQLQLDLGGPEVPETVLVSRVYPFSVSGLREAGEILNFGIYPYLPYTIGSGLTEAWLRDLAVPVPLNPSVTATPTPPRLPQPKLAPPPPVGTPQPRLGPMP